MGRKWITPFAFTDDGGERIYVCVDLLCTDAGLEPTDENMQLALKIAKEMLRERSPQARMRVDPHLGGRG